MTVTEKVAGVVEDAAEIARADVVVPLGAKPKLAGFRLTEGRELPFPAIVHNKVTVPWNPPMLVTVIVDVPLDACSIVNDCGLAAKAKSGLVGVGTVK